jgi:hypothetical protein
MHGVGLIAQAQAFAGLGVEIVSHAHHQGLALDHLQGDVHALTSCPCGKPSSAGSAMPRRTRGLRRLGNYEKPL